jgi:hypothetical protein
MRFSLSRWRTLGATSYTDRALLFRDRQTGLIGEVQLTEPAMAAAKKIGHPLYEQSRSLQVDQTRVPEIETKKKKMYGKVKNG